GVVVGNIIVGNGGTSVSMPNGSVVAVNVKSGNGTDTPTPDNGNVVDGEQTFPGGGDGGGGPEAQTVTFAAEGEVEVGSGGSRFVAPRAGTIIGVRAAAGDPPVGDDIIVDVNKNGSTIYANQGNRPAVPDGNNIGAETTPDVTEIAEGD